MGEGIAGCGEIVVVWSALWGGAAFGRRGRGNRSDGRTVGAGWGGGGGGGGGGFFF